MTTKLEEICARKYPIKIHWVEKDGDSFCLAYLPDWGWSARNARSVVGIGDTITEALENLEAVKRVVISYYLSTGKPIPTPSKGPWEDPLMDIARSEK